MSTTRIDVTKHLGSGLTRALFAMGNEVERSGLEPSLRELVKMRASQVNGCAYCIDMHSKDARAHGETEQRLYALSAWRETPFFSERERAALEWTEAVTRVSIEHPSDELFARVQAQFSEEEIVALTFSVLVINSWNRLSIAFRPLVGSYQPGAYTPAAASA
ncbi:MAG TPA: carboxymuconolactone decarboxylase family protein [Vicinamibacterales bacterium]|nr:carboxymuconolactone decarboxylase family protein [Vicinamibacterales bacterium]